MLKISRSRARQGGGVCCSPALLWLKIHTSHAQRSVLHPLAVLQSQQLQPEKPHPAELSDLEYLD